MSKKPISIKEKPSKKALLDELESIKHLLDDEDSDFDPPLLTEEVGDGHADNDIDGDIDINDLPVLTDSLDLNEDDIPTLDSSIEEDDIVSRAMKAQSLKEPSQSEAEITNTPRTKSLFDEVSTTEETSVSENNLNDELSPEMIALNAMPKDVIKPKTPQIAEPVKAETSNPKQENTSKPESQKILSLEEELESLANDIVNETPVETILDEDHVSETLKEFDDYLVEDDHENENTLLDSEDLKHQGLENKNIDSEDLVDESSENSASIEKDQTPEKLAAGDSLFEETDVELEKNDTEVITANTESINEDDQDINDDHQEKETDDSEESLLAAAILEVTDSITDGSLSEQVQESLAKDEVKNETQSAIKEHQPSLFDTNENDNETPKTETKEAAVTSSAPTSAPTQAELKTNKNAESKTNLQEDVKITEVDESVTGAAPVAKAPPASSKIAVQVNSRKTENPFLPKHIRERLHTNRTLQQEIDDSTAAQASFSGSNANNGVSNNDITTNQDLSPPSTHKAPENTAPQSSSQEDRVIEEVIGSVLPKIESELRQKIKELIKQEKSSD